VTIKIKVYLKKNFSSNKKRSPKVPSWC